MNPPPTSRPPTPVVIGAAILFILLAVLEAMASDRDPRERDPATPWTVHVRQVDEALARDGFVAAERAWLHAYTAAHGSRRWQGMVEVGDAARRIGEATNSRKAGDARARQMYLTALFRARQEGSPDGVLRVAEAFSALGDRQAVAQCVRIAERLAVDRHDTQARDRVLAFSERLSHQENEP